MFSYNIYRAYQIHLFQSVDEDKLFNLFSLYGNIVRIKLLRNKPDHALVQMGDGFQAELAVHFLKVCPRLCLVDRNVFKNVYGISFELRRWMM